MANFSSNFGDNLISEIKHLNNLIEDNIKLVPIEFCSKTLDSIGKTITSIAVKESKAASQSLESKLKEKFGERSETSTYNLKQRLDEAKSFKDLADICEVLLENEMAIDNSDRGTALLSELSLAFGRVKEDNHLFSLICQNYQSFKEGKYSLFFKILQDGVKDKDEDFINIVQYIQRLYLCKF